MSSAPRSLPFIAYLSPLVGVALGYGATELQREFAPVGLFPVLVGIATGLAIVACLRLSGHTSARAHGLAALAAGAVCVQPGCTTSRISYWPGHRPANR